MSLYLLRHGETEGPGGFRGSLDYPLTELGWTTMAAAITAMPTWDLVISSPLIRCLAFAQALAKRQSCQCHMEPDLRELDFGDWEGRTAAELMGEQADDLGRFWSDPYGYTPPNGEPLAAFEHRILKVLRSIADYSGTKRTLLVTHGGVIRLLLARQQGLPREALLQVEVPYASLHPFDSAALGDE
jgi:alpha-ribazole phosphatase